MDQKFYMSDFFRKTIIVFFIFSFLFLSLFVKAQVSNNDSTLAEVTLKTAVDYAVKRQPQILQSLTDEAITASQIRSRLADWYPQINFNYSYQHNFLLPTSIIGGNPIRFGVNNTSAAQFTVTQSIFNKDVLLAKRTKGDVLLQARQSTEENKIELVSNVSKAFYDVLATQQQIKVAAENIVRTERSLQDATNQYKAGITDKIDYKRATISLNNIKASKKSNEEQVRAKIQYLKSLMNYPDSAAFNIIYDSLALEKDVVIDTLQRPDYRNRIEYKLLETQRKLLQSNVLYNKWGFLPTVGINGAYFLNYQNDQVSKLYGNNFPNSYAALTVGLPIFQGGKRKANIRTAELQLSRSDQDIISLKNGVNSQYAQALAVYKGSNENYLALKENVALAKEVYDVIQLQYRSGIKTYLEVITAETDLRTSQINYFNALYQVLSGKVDVQRALGQLTY